MRDDIARVMALLGLLLAAGCVDTTDGWDVTLAQKDLAGDALPDVTLTRLAFEQPAKASKEIFGIQVSDAGIDHDQFGHPGKPVNMACVKAGLQEALPGARLLEPASVWPPGVADRLPLSALLDHLDTAGSPETRPDYLVLAQFRSIEVRRGAGELVFEGAYESKDRLATALLALDRAAQAPVFATRLQADTFQTVAHYLVVVPFVWVQKAVDPCKAPAREAGKAIARAAGRDDVRIALAAAFDDPFAALEASRAASRERSGHTASDPLTRLRPHHQAP